MRANHVLAVLAMRGDLNKTSVVKVRQAFISVPPLTVNIEKLGMDLGIRLLSIPPPQVKR